MMWAIVLKSQAHNRNSVHAICNTTVSTPFAECLAINPDIIKDEDEEVEHGPSTTEILDWKKAQQQDRMIKRWIEMVVKQQKPQQGDRILKRQFNHLKIIEGILYRVVNSDDEMKKQLVLPSQLVNDFISVIMN